MLEKLDRFLSIYILESPQSELLDVIYKYDMYMTSLNINDIIDKVKRDFNLIFNEHIEKYIFLRLTENEFFKLLILRSFHCSNEYDLIKGIVLWLKYDLDNRLDDAQLLFNLVNYRLCDIKIMLENKIIYTGNIKLDNIIKQVHLKISIHNDKTILQYMDYYKVGYINSFDIPSNEQTTNKYNGKSCLSKLANGGISDTSNHYRILNYNFVKKIKLFIQ